MTIGAFVHLSDSPSHAQNAGTDVDGGEGNDALAVGEIRVEGEAQSPFDPVGGYSAERSATATRMDIPIDETPAPVQVVPKEILEDSGADRVDDALDFTAGTQKTNTFGGKQEGILLRGFRATFAENGVAGGGGSTVESGVRDSATVERVEVLRGPASALYGQSAPGGIVNVVTKRPQPETFLEAESAASTFDRLRQTFDANTAFGADNRWQVRLNGALEVSDSFRDQVDSNRQVVAPALTFEANDDVRVHYRGEYQRDAGEFDRGVPVNSDGDLLTDRETYLGDPDDGDTVTENLGSELEAEVDVAPDWTVRVLGGWDRSRLDGDQTEPRLLAPFNLPPSQLGVPVTANETLFRIRRERDQESTFWTGRADITGEFTTGTLAHQALVSFEARDIQRDSVIRQTDVLGQPDIVDITALQNDTAEQPPSQLSDVTNDITNYGLVAFDRIKPIEAVSLLAGGRLDFVDQTQHSTDNSGTTVTDVNETAFSPTIGAVVRPVQWGSIFGRYSQSFQVNTETDQNNEALPPQEGESIEGGVRVNLRDGALRGTLTVFNIELENEPQAAGPNTTFSVPATRTSTGVEVSLQGAITDHLSVIANYTYTDAELSDVPGPRDGERPQGVPEHAANLFANYDIEGGRFDGVSLNGGAIFNGDRLNANTQTVSAGPLPNFNVGGNELDSYLRFDVGASYAIQSWLAAGVKVENLTDADYERPSIAGFAMPEPGRTFSGRVQLRF
jgi:iron complex outermembrane receptor protein